MDMKFNDVSEQLSKEHQPNIWILEDDKGCQFVYEQILKNDFKTTYF